MFQNYAPNIPKQNYPANYSRYLTTLVAGIKFCKEDALRFAKSENQSLLFERDRENKHDKHAIRIIGMANGIRHFIGYVPKETANQIVKSKLENFVIPELARIFYNSNNFVEVRFHVLGPSEFLKKFRDQRDAKPLSAEQRDFFEFFDLPIPRGYKFKDALNFQSEFLKKLRFENPVLEKEFDSYQQIFDDFQDKYFRKDYEIKKPTRASLKKSLISLKNSGYSYNRLADEPEIIIDELRWYNPLL